MKEEICPKELPCKTKNILSCFWQANRNHKFLIKLESFLKKLWRDHGHGPFPPFSCASEFHPSHSHKHVTATQGIWTHVIPIYGFIYFYFLQKYPCILKKL